MKKKVSNLTKAGSFASKLIKDGVPGGIACHAAASYYKEDASDVGSELNRRKKFRKQRPIDHSPIGQQAVAQNTKQPVSQNWLNERMEDYGSFVHISKKVFSCPNDEVYFFAISEEGRVLRGRYQNSEGKKLLKLPFSPSFIQLFSKKDSIVFSRYSNLRVLKHENH